MNIPNKDALKTQICNATGCQPGTASQLCTAIENHAGGNLGTGKCMGLTCNPGGGAKQVFHISVGIIGKNQDGASVFFIENPAGTCQVVAIGHHTGPKSYKIDDSTAIWTHGKKVDLK